MAEVPNPFEAPAAFYNHLAEHVRDPRFAFMNYGYVDPEAPEDLAWVEPDDRIWRYSINLLKRLVGNVDLSGKEVLDVGCGRGGNCAALVRYFRVARVVGLDASAGAVAAAGRAVADPRVEFVEGDALALPFLDGRFAAVTNIESAQHYPSKEKFFREVSRVLGPGGRFFITDFSMNVLEVEALAETVGFMKLDFENISAGAQAAVVRCKEERVALLRDFVAKGTASTETVEWIIGALEGHDPDEDVHYHRWILQKKG